MTEHEELLKLRALVEKQAAELTVKNQVIEALTVFVLHFDFVQ